MQFYRELKLLFGGGDLCLCLRVVQFYRELKHDWRRIAGTRRLRVVQVYRELKHTYYINSAQFVFESSAVL